MTDASTRPVIDDDWDAGFPPPPPAPDRPRHQIPDARWSTVWLVIAGAFITNLAVQGRPASVAAAGAVVLAGAVILASPVRQTPSALLAVGLACAVASNLVLRASDWVTGPTIIAAVALLVLAVVDQLAAARLATIAGSVRVVLDGAAGSVRHLVGPFARWLGPTNEERWALTRGLLIATVVASLLTLLLANADAVVDQVIGQSLQSSAWAHVAITAVFALAFAAAAAASHGRVVESPDTWAPTDRPIEALMGLGAMVLVLGSWVGVQAAVALGGADRLLATASVTRAEHAREGFFELVVVAAVVLVLLAAFGRLLGTSRPTSTLALLSTVGVLTTVLVGVTFSRLALYIDAFGLTMLRLSVAWFLGWMALLVVAVTVWSCGVARQRTWLTSLAVISAAAVVAVFGWSNPEGTVAATNLARDNAIVDLDVDYLRTLGPDAAAELRALGFDPGVECSGELHPFGPFGWNRSWAQACATEG